jgi:predicted transcriptional regulator
MDDKAQAKDKLALVSDIVSSYLRRNSVGMDEIGRVVSNVTTAMRGAESLINGGGDAGQTEQVPAEKGEPAVSVRASVRPDYLVCLDCGAKAKTLKRHLMTAHGLTPQQYREKWGLKKEYPMTAPAYSERRSAMAKSRGLGRKPGEGRKEAKKKAAPRRSPRKKPAAAAAE